MVVLESKVAMLVDAPTTLSGVEVLGEILVNEVDPAGKENDAAAPFGSVPPSRVTYIKDQNFYHLSQGKTF